MTAMKGEISNMKKERKYNGKDGDVIVGPEPGTGIEQTTTGRAGTATGRAGVVNRTTDSGSSIIPTR